VKSEAEIWEEGRKAGHEYERDMWYWQAGALSRAVNGLKERPIWPTNPYLEKKEEDEV
jgi:hypothetical protein